MPEPVTQPSADGGGRHLILFDGVCGLCSRLVQFVLARDRRRAFSFASLQSPVGRAAVARAGGNPEELTTLYVFTNYREQEGRRSPGRVPRSSSFACSDGPGRLGD